MRRRKRRLITLFVLIPLFFFLAGTAYFIYTYATIDLTRQLEEPSIILDRNGKQVSRFSSEIRQVVSLEEMSPYLLQAFIAIEDSRFYQHFGLDPRGLARALWHNLRKGKIVEGGSTITQQLAENEYFIGVSGPARSLGKKIEEAIYAIKLERTYTKDEILERYLNRIYFGHGRFGVEAASQYYFGKSAADLSLSEAAMLAGIPNAPAVYSLRDNPDNAHARRNLVLARMEELGYISAAEREEAEAQVLTPAPPQEKTASANHFRQRVEKELRSIFSRLYPAMSDKEITNLIYNQGLTIHTTLSLEAQAAAEKVMTEYGQDLRQQNPNIQGVLG
ncbi:MAG: penicillin-binding protein, partial [Firmicutes bacterium]|nr:penicillin-binding protein [Bacillota bacterium]